MIPEHKVKDNPLQGQRDSTTGKEYDLLVAYSGLVSRTPYGIWAPLKVILEWRGKSSPWVHLVWPPEKKERKGKKKEKE